MLIISKQKAPSISFLILREDFVLVILYIVGMRSKAGLQLFTNTKGFLINNKINYDANVSFLQCKGRCGRLHYRHLSLKN